MCLRPRLLLLLLALCGSASGKKGHSKLAKRAHRKGGKHGTAEQEERTTASQDVDVFAKLSPDSLWRIKAVPSGGSLYAGPRGRMVVSRHFFTLFRAQPAGSGAYKLVQYPSGRVMYHHPPGSKQAESEDLERTFSDKEDNSHLALLPPVQNKRRVHSNLMGGSMYLEATSPPPAPLLSAEEAAAAEYRAKEIHELFFPIAQDGGPVAFRVGTKSSTHYVHETSNHTFEVRDADPKHRGRHAPLSATAHFQLLEVSNYIPPEDIAGAANRHVSSHRIKQNALKLGGREVVVLTAYNIGSLDTTPLFLGWMNASGIQRLMHLQSDGLACAATQTLNAQLSKLISMDCISCRELMWAGGVRPRSLEHNKISHWETEANANVARVLRRCKLRLLELTLKARVDALFLDVGVMLTSPEYLTSLVARAQRVDLAIAADAQLGFTDPVMNDYGCVGVSESYWRQVRDWVSAAQFYVRSTSASRWFVRETQKLMDKFGLTDADALQSLLTGHTQVADPKRVGLEPGSVYNDSGADQVWLKPAWVEADDEPLYYRALAFQRWIRPLNAPMDPMLYNENLKEMRQRGFIWEMLPEEEFVTASHTLLKNWSLRYGRSLGSIRVDGTRNGNVRSVQLNCQTKTFLSMPENKGSFLFRPESHKVTWEKFCDDFPIEAPAMARVVLNRGEQPAGSKCAFPGLYGFAPSSIHREGKQGKSAGGKKKNRKRKRSAE